MQNRIEFESTFDIVLLRNAPAESRAAMLFRFQGYLRAIANDFVDLNLRKQMGIGDFVQQTIIRANQNIAQCRAANVGQFKAWLRKILLHEIFNRYRELKTAKRDVDREERLKLPIADNQPSPSNALIQKEEREALSLAISKLKPEQQLVVLARFREQETFVEIAARMSRTPDSVRMVWKRAIKQLATILEPTMCT